MACTYTYQGKEYTEQEFRDFVANNLVTKKQVRKYDKVWFPKGDTAAKVEGHTTLSEFKTQQETRIKNLEGYIKANEEKLSQAPDLTILSEKGRESVLDGTWKLDLEKGIEKWKAEIKQVEQELERVDREGFGALKPIYSFYENNISNILKKFGATTEITDEFGNTWTEVDLSNEKVLEQVSPIALHIPNTYQTAANNETITKLKELLNRLGVKVEYIDDLLTEHGGNAIVDLAEKLIKIGNGMENIALTEEAMHILSVMLPESVYNDLLDQITDFKIYKQTLEQYGGLSLYQNPDGSINLDKIKLEAIGKLLAEYYIMGSENLTPKEVNVAKTLWARIKDWLLNVFNIDHRDSFQDLINQLEEGELILTGQPSRHDVLLQAAFTRENINQVNEVLSRDVNQRVITALKTSIQRIKSKDIPVIYNNLKKISGIDKQPFGYSIGKITPDKNNLKIKDPKDELDDMISYIGSINTVTSSLRHETENITKNLESGIDPLSGEPFTPKQISKMHGSVYYINQIAQIYRNQLSIFKAVLSESKDDTQAIKDFREVITSAIGNITEIEDSFAKTSNQEAIAVFNRTIDTKVKNTLSNQKKELSILQMRYAKDPSKRLEDKIKDLENQIANPLTGEQILEELQKPAFSGWFGWWHKFADGILTNKQQDIQAVANTIYSKILESRAEATPDVDETGLIAKEYISRQSGKAVDLDTYYNPLLVGDTGIVHRYEYQPSDKGTREPGDASASLREWDEVRLLSEHDQYRWENDIALALYKVSQLEDQITEETNPKALEFLNEQLTKAKEELKTLDSYGQDKYTQEYHDIQKELLVTLSDGKTTVKDVRDQITAELKDLESQIVHGISDMQLESILDQRQELFFKLQRLESKVNLDNTDKTGDDLLIAETITNWKALKRENEMDGSFISNVSKARWMDQKMDIDDRLANAESVFKTAATPANKKAYELAIKAHELWYRLNTRVELPDAFYEERKDILAAISEVLEPYLADPAVEEQYKEETDVLWNEIYNATKGLKDEDNVINGTLAEDLAERIKDNEVKLQNLKDAILEERIEVSEYDRKMLKALYEDLNEIQDTPLTKYWEQKVTHIKSALKADIINDPANASKTPKQIDVLVNKAFTKTDFFKNNVTNVTQQFKEVASSKLPSNVFRIGSEVYKPIYIWRETVPVGEKYQKIHSPSLKWRTYKVNDKFVNENYKTIQGKKALDPAKAIPYINQKYRDLSPQDKETLRKYKEVYYKNQMNKGEAHREGDALPKIQSEGLQKIKQRTVNAKKLITDPKQLFSKSLWKDITGQNPTELEAEYGEGLSEDAEDFKGVKVMAKFSNKNLKVTRQDKDIFKVLTLYIIESHKYSKMWDIVPVLSTVKDRVSKEKREVVEYAIDKLVNNKSKRASTVAGRAIRQLQGFAQSSLAFFRLGLPWMLTGVLKNELQGMWQIMLMSTWFDQYTQANLVTALGRAAKHAPKLAVQGPLGANTDKYTAIVRHLNLIPSLNIYNRANVFNSTFTKSFDNARYLLNIQRETSEIHLALTMYELFKGGFKPWGDNKTIEDMYDFTNNVLTPKMKPVLDDKGQPVLDENEQPVLEPIITRQIEEEITLSVKNMFQFTQGNYDYANGVLAKSYWLGSSLLFMKNFIYNTAEALVGGKRTLSTGQELEGSYRIFWSLFRESAWNIVGRNDLTPNEKAGLMRFYMHTLLVNTVGIGLYAAGAALGDDDDDEATAAWYALNLGRKTYSEIAFFNMFDKAAVQADIIFGDRAVANSQTGNPIYKSFMFAVGNPAIDLVSASILPVDYKSLKFSNDIKTTDPFFKQYKDDGLMYDFMKIMRAKPEIIYPESSYRSFLYYDESIYDYEKGEDSKEKQKDSKSSSGRRRNTNRQVRKRYKRED